MYDLAFGTHRLLTRPPTELGTGHPATLTQHFAVFLLVPLVVTDEQFEEGLNVLEGALASVAESRMEATPQRA